MKRMLIGMMTAGLLMLSGCGKGTGSAASGGAAELTTAAAGVLEHYAALGGPDLVSRAGEVDGWMKTHQTGMKELEPDCGKLGAETQAAGRRLGLADKLCVFVMADGINRGMEKELQNYDHTPFNPNAAYDKLSGKAAKK